MTITTENDGTITIDKVQLSLPQSPQQQQQLLANVQVLKDNQPSQQPLPSSLDDIHDNASVQSSESNKNVNNKKKWT